MIVVSAKWLKGWWKYYFHCQYTFNMHVAMKSIRHYCLRECCRQLIIFTHAIRVEAKIHRKQFGMNDVLAKYCKFCFVISSLSSAMKVHCPMHVMEVHFGPFESYSWTSTLEHHCMPIVSTLEIRSLCMRNLVVAKRHVNGFFGLELKLPYKIYLKRGGDNM